MRSLELIVTLLSRCSSVRLSETGVHCYHRVHFSADLSLRLDSQMFWAPWHQNVSTYSQKSFSSSIWKRREVWMRKVGVISQERLKISYYWVLIGSHTCRVDWHNNGWPWVTLNALLSASRAISAVAKLLAVKRCRFYSRKVLIQLMEICIIRQFSQVSDVCFN